MIVFLSFDTYSSFNFNSNFRLNSAQLISSNGLSILFSDSLGALTIVTSGDAASSDSLKINLRPFIAQLSSRFESIDVGNIPPEEMSIAGEGKKIKAKIHFSNIQMNREGSAVKPIMYTFSIFIGRKE
jgi:hypothetical protein